MEVWGWSEPFSVGFVHWGSGCLYILYLPKPEIPKGNEKKMEKRLEVPPGLGSAQDSSLPRLRGSLQASSAAKDEAQQFRECFPHPKIGQTLFAITGTQRRLPHTEPWDCKIPQPT